MGDDVTFVKFAFAKLPPQFCVRCRKLGHKQEDCEDDFAEDDNVILQPQQAITQLVMVEEENRRKPRQLNTQFKPTR